jgi:hypothetical protein
MKIDKKLASCLKLCVEDLHSPTHSTETTAPSFVAK